MSTSLGFIRSAPWSASPASLPVSHATRNHHFFVIPLRLIPLYPILSLSALLTVQLGLKNAHAHPLTHEERFLWQSNLLLNILITYLAIQSCFPVIHIAARRCESRVIDTGLWVDIISFWSFAVACLIPVHIYTASGDIPSADVAAWVGVYVLLFCLLVLNVILFVRSVSHES